MFVLAHWHGLAKLKLHTDSTLKALDDLTSILGDEFRSFECRTSKDFATRELQREFEARSRAAAAKAKKNNLCPPTTANLNPNETLSSGEEEILSHGGIEIEPDSEQAENTSPKGISLGRRFRTFNNLTYKGHSFGDYVATIRRHGTTDSYSTELVCNCVRGCASLKMTLNLAGRVGTSESKITVP